MRPDNMPDWSNIETVFLDMDGTLLDLHFDNHFWREHVPQRYAQLHNMDLDQAREILIPKFKQHEGTMNWYCLDFWTAELDLDIALLKEEVDHLIAVHPYVVEFLDALRQSGRRVLLVTNAHFKSLNLKMQRTQLCGHFDKLVCAHDFGVPKEDVTFWDKLQSTEPFDKARTLLIDDSLPVLKSARAWGIAHLLAVYKPDSRSPEKDVEDFDALQDFREIMPDSDFSGGIKMP